MQCSKVRVARDQETGLRLDMLHHHLASTKQLPGFTASQFADLGVTGYAEYGVGRPNPPSVYFPQLGEKTWDMLFKFELGDERTVWVGFYYYVLTCHRLCVFAGGEWRAEATVVSDIEIARIVRALHRECVPDAAKRRTANLKRATMAVEMPRALVTA